MGDTKRINSLLSASGTYVKKQDGGFLLYNTNPKHVSHGILLADLSSVEKVLLQYLRYLQTNGVSSLLDFAESGLLRGTSYKEVNNTVDENSAYFINKSASLSPVSRLNLLASAATIEDRVRTEASVREARSSITDECKKRYLKLKKVAKSYFDGVE